MDFVANDALVKPIEELYKYLEEFKYKYHALIGNAESDFFKKIFANMTAGTKYPHDIIKTEFTNEVNKYHEQFRNAINTRRGIKKSYQTNIGSQATIFMIILVGAMVAVGFAFGKPSDGEENLYYVFRWIRLIVYGMIPFIFGITVLIFWIDFRAVKYTGLVYNNRIEDELRQLTTVGTCVDASESDGQSCEQSSSETGSCLFGTSKQLELNDAIQIADTLYFKITENPNNLSKHSVVKAMQSMRTNVDKLYAFVSREQDVGDVDNETYTDADIDAAIQKDVYPLFESLQKSIFSQQITVNESNISTSLLHASSNAYAPELCFTECVKDNSCAAAEVDSTGCTLYSSSNLLGTSPILMNWKQPATSEQGKGHGSYVKTPSMVLSTLVNDEATDFVICSTTSPSTQCPYVIDSTPYRYTGTSPDYNNYIKLFGNVTAAESEDSKNISVTLPVKDFVHRLSAEELVQHANIIRPVVVERIGLLHQRFVKTKEFDYTSLHDRLRSKFGEQYVILQAVFDDMLTEGTLLANVQRQRDEERETDRMRFVTVERFKEKMRTITVEQFLKTFYGPINQIYHVSAHFTGNENNIKLVQIENEFNSKIWQALWIFACIILGVAVVDYAVLEYKPKRTTTPNLSAANISRIFRIVLCASVAVFIIVILYSHAQKVRFVNTFNSDVIEKNGTILKDRSSFIYQSLHSEEIIRVLNIRSCINDSAYDKRDEFHETKANSDKLILECSLNPKIATGYLLEDQKTPAWSAFESSLYTDTLAIINAYEKCNSVTIGTGKQLPFPISEAVVLIIILLIIVGLFLWMYTKVNPTQAFKYMKQMMSDQIPTKDNDYTEMIAGIQDMNDNLEPVWWSIGIFLVAAIFSYVIILVFNSSELFKRNIYSSRYYEDSKCYD